jgi:hypothetical protein
MKEIYYTYNNEAIASCVFLNVLEIQRTMDVARACLVLPFLLDDRTVKYLQRLENLIRLEFIVNEQTRLFTSFNKRYLSLLPITINSLIILNQNNQVGFTQNEVYIKEAITYNEIDMGLRFNEIIKVIPLLLSILENYTTIELYRILKIQL